MSMKDVPTSGMSFMHFVFSGYFYKPLKQKEDALS